MTNDPSSPRTTRTTFRTSGVMVDGTWLIGSNPFAPEPGTADTAAEIAQGDRGEPGSYVAIQGFHDPDGLYSPFCADYTGVEGLS